MAFGKAVFAKAFHLLETTMGESRIIAARDHAGDHHLLVVLDRANLAERRHGTAQAIGLVSGKAGRIDGNLHGLLLEERDAERAFQDLFELVGRAVFRCGARIGDGLLTLSAAQIWVDHVALDRAGAYDGDFDDKVIKDARAKARQHVHLRAALDLEDAEAITLTQHVIGHCVIRRDGGEIVLDPFVKLQEIEGLADTGQHAEGEHVDLHDVQGGDVVLVPFDKGALIHGGIADRHGFSEQALGQHEAADML